MKAPRVDRIIPYGAIPSWFESILSPLNVFIQQVTSGLKKNITFTENINSQLIELEFSTPSDYTSNNFNELYFKRNLPTKPFGLFICKIEEKSNTPSIIKSAVSVIWHEIDGEIYIDWVSGLENSKTYKTILMLV